MPFPFKKILVPTDFSSIGDAAVPIAFRLAKDHGGSVLVLHAVEGHATPNPLYAHYEPNPTPEQVEEMRERTEKEMEKRVPPALARGVRWEARAVPGPPAEAILKAARDESVSVIVIGSHGWSGLKHLLYGSTAKAVLEEAPCPVVLYRP